MLAITIALLLGGSLLAATHRSPTKEGTVKSIRVRGGSCALPWTKSVTDGAGVTTTLDLCLSPEGNLTALSYPHTAAADQQLSFDAYCLSYQTPQRLPVTAAADFGGAAGTPASFGFGPATISEPGGPNTNPITVTRSTTDGKFQVSEYIKVNVVPRSIAVVVTIKNTSGVTQNFFYERAVAPKIGGDAGNDQYNVFDRDSVGAPTAAQVFDSSGSQSLVVSVASNTLTQDPQVLLDPRADWLTNASGGGDYPCDGANWDASGPVSGGNRVVVARALRTTAGLANNATAKITYDFRLL